MQSLVVQIFIAVLVLCLLWSLDRGRKDLRLKFWIVAWLLVTLRFASLLWHPVSATVLRMREARFALLEVVAAVFFILSDPAIARSRSLQVRTALLSGGATVCTAGLLLFRPVSTQLLLVAIIASHVLAIAFSRRYASLPRGKFFSLSALHFLSGSFMLGALALHHQQLILASIPAELFAVNAILFGRNYPMRYPGNILAVSGFVLWSASSFIEIAMHQPITLPHALGLPQLLVAVGMVMIIMEQDSSNARRLVHEYELLYNNNPFPLWIYDLKTTRVLSANPASAQLHGYSVEEMCCRKLGDLVHPDMAEAMESDLSQPQAKQHRQSKHRRKDGTSFPMNVTAYDIDFHGRPARIALAEDVSERERLASQLVYQVQHDSLTGLPNRAAFLQELEKIFIPARMAGTGCAVLVLHVNRFEKVNENYGHVAGDEFLKELTERLRARTRPTDVIGRTGSREFTIAFPCALQGEGIEGRARDLLRAISEPVRVRGHSVAPSLSMGLAVYPDDSDDTHALLRDAARAQALTQAPGGDNVMRLSRQMGSEAEEQNRIETRMQYALANEGFEVHYQPILGTDGMICAFEALLRLHDGAGGLISPCRFIPIAESTGDILSIGSWVITDVCRTLQQWIARGVNTVPVAINVSALQILQPGFADEVFAMLEQHQLGPERIHLEITESSAMPQDDIALENMMRLATAGIHFSIDDFGTGFSSLYRLHKIPAALLKIDRSFVAGMLEPDGTLPIIQTIISMAHSLNVGVVAEGVETRDQFHTLYEMGCDQFQGYYFHRPASAQVTLTLLAPDSSLTEQSVAKSTSPTLAAPLFGAQSTAAAL